MQEKLPSSGIQSRAIHNNPASACQFHSHYTFILCILVTTKQCSYDIFVFRELAYFTKHSSLLQVDPFCWKRWGFILFVAKSILSHICAVVYWQLVDMRDESIFQLWELSCCKYESADNSRMLTSFPLDKFPGMGWLGMWLIYFQISLEICLPQQLF